MNKQLLRESSYNVSTESGENGTHIRGIFATANVLNQNKRIYRRPILEREIEKLQKDIHNRSLYGQLDHPSGAESELSKAAILITELSWDGDNVMGKAKVLSTPMGEVVKAIITAGGSVGVSSRGLGTVAEDGTVNDNLNLLTFDLVSSPSNPASWVNSLCESAKAQVDSNKIDKNLFHWERGAFSAPMQESKLPVKASDFYFKPVNESSPYSSHMSWAMWWGKVRQIWADRDTKQVLTSRNMKFKPGAVIREGDIAKLVKRDWQVNMVPKNNDKKYRMYLRETRELTADNFLLPHEDDGKWTIFENDKGEVIFARWDTEDQIAVQFENGDEKFFQSMQEFINFIKGVYTLVGVAPEEEVEQEIK